MALCLLAGAAGMAGCASGPALDPVQTDAPHIVARGQPLPDAQVALEYHILAGELAVQRGNRAVAAREYVAALDYSSDPELTRRAARVALFAGEPALALKAARAWAAAEPTSQDARKAAARLALRQGQAAVLQHQASALIDSYPQSPAEGFRTLADTLAGEPEQADLALDTLSSLVQAHAGVAEAHYALGLLALRYERYDAADKAVARALAIRPGWADAALLRAGILVRRGEVEAARSLVAGLEGSRVERAEYLLSFARLLLDADQTRLAADIFEQVLSLQPDNADARYGLGLLALSLEQRERARTAFATLYEQGKRRDDAAFYLGNIAMANEHYRQARRWYGRVVRGSHAFDAKVLAARARYKSGDLAGARSDMAALRQAQPELADRLYLAEGEMLFDAGQHEQALKLYNRALDDSPYDDDLLYARSLAYEKLGRIDAAEADLQAIIERQPDDARALNALGYMLTNHSQRYQQALDYIHQAFEAEPEDPAIIDSLGWIHYRLGNLQQAREHLERAYSLFPDPEVAAHFGEVLWQLGKQEQARRIWQEALAEDPDNLMIRDTMQRLTQ